MTVAADESALWIVESNSEQVLRVTPAGVVSRVLDLSGDNLTPNAIVAAPGGGVYVGFLSAAPYPAGSASVILVDESGASETVWTGLTAITGLAVDSTGVLHASQMATTRANPPHFQLSTGSIVRQTGPDTHEVIATGLNLPVSLEIGPDGALYTALPAIGGDNNAGNVLRVDPAARGLVVDLEGLTPPICGDGTGGSIPDPSAGGDTEVVDDGTGGALATVPAGEGDSGATTSEIVVRIFDLGFDPPMFNVPVGSTVIWANTGNVEHTVNGAGPGDMLFDSGPIPPGGVFAFTLSEVGPWRFACSFHPEMTAAIIVE
jgi:plastocyanin